MDGRTCVQQMLEAEYSQWAQDEWAGFYFEFVGLPVADQHVRRRTAGVRQDAVRLRAGSHLGPQGTHGRFGVAPLNDQGCDGGRCGAGGVGFLVLTGRSSTTTASFGSGSESSERANGKPAKATHDAQGLRAQVEGVVQAVHGRGVLPPGPQRRSTPHSIGGILKIMKQGRQTSGHARQPKYALDLVKARLSEVLLGQLVL